MLSGNAFVATAANATSKLSETNRAIDVTRSKKKTDLNDDDGGRLETHFASAACTQESSQWGTEASGYVRACRPLRLLLNVAAVPKRSAEW